MATAGVTGFCLCADDYAMSPGVSRGILECLAAGRLSATSAMTTSPFWSEDAAALMPFRSTADIGLHLNLTAGRPLGPMPRLAPDGSLPGIGPLIRAARTGHLDEDEIAAEIERQCERFHDATGVAPDHVDGHQHVQAIGPVRRCLLRVLAKRRWRPWIRVSGDRPDRILMRRGALRKAAIVSLIGRGSLRDVRSSGLRCNDSFAGFSPFDEEANVADAFARYLRAPGQRHLVMCHPGYVDDALRAMDPVHRPRENELAFLLSARFTELLDRAAMRLVRPSRAWP